MKNSIGYNASIGLHSTNHWVAMPIYAIKPLVYNPTSEKHKIFKRV